MNCRLKVNCRIKCGLAQPTVGRPAQILSYNSLWVYNQTCTTQGLKISHFGKLPDVVLPKIPKKKISQIVKIWRFLWKATSGSAKIAEFQFWRATRCDFIKNCSKCQKKRKLRISVLPDVDFTNLDYLTRFFGIFEQFLAKPHFVARQSVTFWTFGKNMSVYNSL